MTSAHKYYDYLRFCDVCAYLSYILFFVFHTNFELHVGFQPAKVMFGQKHRTLQVHSVIKNILFDCLES